MQQQQQITIMEGYEKIKTTFNVKPIRKDNGSGAGCNKEKAEDFSNTCLRNLNLILERSTQKKKRSCTKYCSARFLIQVFHR